MVRKWINERLKERTTIDGVVLVAAGIAFLIFKPLASLVAYGAIAYGAWTIWKAEQSYNLLISKSLLTDKFQTCFFSTPFFCANFLLSQDLHT